jgi:LysM repeat protein
VQNRMLRVAAALAAIGLVSACEAPTPTVADNAAPEVAAPSPDTPTQTPAAEGGARQIVVEAGQSVSRIAAKYGIPKRTLIAANDLTPPYKLRIGQELRIPSADQAPPAPAVAGSPPPEVISADRPVLPEGTAPPPAANQAPVPDLPAVKHTEAAAPAGAKSPEPLPAPAVPVQAATGGPPTSPGSAESPAPATTAAASSPTPTPAAAPPGVICPSGTIGMWSEDIIKKALYVCHKLGSPS